MTDQQQWKRDTAIRQIRRAIDADPSAPVSRLIKPAATYVGASEAEVRAWWNGRTAP
jgi:hypothetical protein